jgi:hypothetical protein
MVKVEKAFTEKSLKMKILFTNTLAWEFSQWLMLGLTLMVLNSSYVSLMFLTLMVNTPYLAKSILD